MPLSFDYPLEKLKSYAGNTPVPSDFDAYWDRALEEMRSVEPKVELIPAKFAAPFAECFDMYFTGVGGARVHAKLLRPKASAPRSGPRPALLMFHGYSNNSGDFFDKLPYVAAGYTVAAMDCRGQGGLSEDVGGVSGNTLNGHIVRGLKDALEGRPEKLLYRQIFLDAAELAHIVMEMPGVDPARVGVTGISQGGGLSVACAALVPEIALAAPVYPFLSDYRRVWEMDEAKDAYVELAEYFRRFDPTHEREEDAFRMLGYVDIQNLAPRVAAKTLWAAGLMDTVCPPSTQFAAYNKLACAKEMVLYPDFSHETLSGHSDKIFSFMMGL